MTIFSYKNLSNQELPEAAVATKEIVFPFFWNQEQITILSDK